MVVGLPEWGSVKALPLLGRRLVARYATLDLLALDEVGYVSLDPRGAELLFQIITAREERASIACASNAPFSN